MRLLCAILFIAVTILIGIMYELPFNSISIPLIWVGACIVYLATGKRKSARPDAGERIKELIYSTGKGVEIQVWDGGTCWATLLYDRSISAKAETVEEALQKLIDQVEREDQRQ